MCFMTEQEKGQRNSSSVNNAFRCASCMKLAWRRKQGTRCRICTATEPCRENRPLRKKKFVSERRQRPLNKTIMAFGMAAFKHIKKALTLMQAHLADVVDSADVELPEDAVEEVIEVEADLEDEEEDEVSLTSCFTVYFNSSTSRWRSPWWWCPRQRSRWSSQREGCTSRSRRRKRRR